MLVFSLQYFLFPLQLFWIHESREDISCIDKKTVLGYTIVHYLTNLMLAFFFTTSTYF